MLFFNELSIHGQFQAPDALRTSLLKLLTLRKLSTDAGFRVQVKRATAERPATDGQPLRACLRGLGPELARLLALWFDRDGPFWEDGDRHPEDTYLECRGEIVTDTGLGEATFRLLRSLDAATISLAPSIWEDITLSVDERSDAAHTRVDVKNHIIDESLKAWLAAREAPLTSWAGLASWAIQHCPRLQLGATALEALKGHPFHHGAAERVQDRLRVLQRMAASVAPDTGKLGDEGQELLQRHFVGEKAWFSDSSALEKSDFAKDLMFPHPGRADEKVFASWHGKVRSPQLRIHYVHEFSREEPTYVVYIGPKLTKR